MQEAVEIIDGIEMIPVKSGTVSKVGFGEPDKRMLVKFNSGTLYEYKDVSKEEFTSIKDDASIGSKLRKVMAKKEYKKL